MPAQATHAQIVAFTKSPGWKKQLHAACIEMRHRHFSYNAALSADGKTPVLRLRWYAWTEHQMNTPKAAKLERAWPDTPLPARLPTYLDTTVGGVEVRIPLEHSKISAVRTNKAP